MLNLNAHHEPLTDILEVTDGASAHRGATRSGVRRRWWVVASDAVALAGALVVTLLIFHSSPRFAEVHGEYIFLSFALIPVRIGCMAHMKLYFARHVSTHRDEISKLGPAILFSFLIEVALAYLLKLEPPRSWTLTTFVISLAAVALNRELVRAHFSLLRQSGRLAMPVLVVGAGPAAREIAEIIDNDTWAGYQVAGFVDDIVPVGSLVGGRHPVVGRQADLVECARRLGAQGVVVPATETDQPSMNSMLRRLAWDGVFVDLTFGVQGIAAQRTKVRSIGRSQSVLVEPLTMRGWRPAVKRAVDVAVSSALLVISAPLLVGIAFAIKIESKGPVLFRGSRYGRGGTVFPCLKFRSMVDDAENHEFKAQQIKEFGGMAVKTKADPRVTRVGKFLRRWSLDELPQLFNILRGDMSLVGPRPLPLDDALVTEWDDILPYRHLVRPGLTCTWQVSGRSDTTNEDRRRLDLYYVDNWTLWIDLMILGRTALVVARGSGAY